MCSVIGSLKVCKDFFNNRAYVENKDPLRKRVEFEKVEIKSQRSTSVDNACSRADN